MNRWVERVRKCSWAQLLLIATASGVFSGVVFAILGAYSCDAIVMYLNHGKETELGSAVLAIYTFLAFGTTGFVAAFSTSYAIARRQAYCPVMTTSIAACINLLGWFVPTGGHALMPFYASLAMGVGLTLAFSSTGEQDSTRRARASARK
jgi:hypothetical protein